MLNSLYQIDSAEIPAVLDLVSPEDALLFRQDGCYLLLQTVSWPTQQLFALASDVAVRQIPTPSAVELVDDLQWVELCCQAKRIIKC